MDTFIFILTTLGIGALCSIPGIILGKWMVAKGLVRKEVSAKWMVGSAIIAFFVLRLLLPQVSLVWIIIGVSVVWWGLYKSDLWTTLHRGRWWWEENPEPLTLSEELISFLVVVGVIGLAIVFMILVS